MATMILLDSGPLGKLVHPRRYPELKLWAEALTLAGGWLMIPEIVDYEIRRNLILEDLQKSIDRLDQLKATYDYLPLSTDVMQRAALFWAQARKRGRPTAAEKELDGDVILAAQAALLVDEGYTVIVATENLKHLGLFVDARRYQDITL